MSKPSLKPPVFHRAWHQIAALAFLAILTGCSPIRAFNAFIPESGFVAARDIAYGDLPRQKLDVYRPTAVSSGPRTVVVFFYGGAWDSGSKGDFLFAAEALVSRGYVVVVPDYRVYPEVIFPTFMDDAARAIKWTFDHAREHGGDPAKVFVMGHSAGAQIAALAAYDKRFLEKAGSDARRIRGVVSLAGPMDFLPLTEPKLFFIFPENVRPASQPINFVTGKEPPTLLLHGEADTRVGLHNTRNIAARLRERGSEVEVTTFPELSHTGIIVAISVPFRNRRTVLERIAKFIDERAPALPSR